MRAKSEPKNSATRVINSARVAAWSFVLTSDWASVKENARSR